MAILPVIPSPDREDAQVKSAAKLTLRDKALCFNIRL
jgi:hypothetical protein